MKKFKIFTISILLIILISVICGIVYYFNNYSSTLEEPSNITTDEEFINITYDKEESLLSDDILGILAIDKIGLNATVKEGSSNDVLKEYIGHIENTSTYDGNVCLAAHNRGNKYSYFARINELEVGDIITYKTNFYTRSYKVDNIKTIFETDWSMLENSTDNKITLITCIANKKNQRLCVQATEVTEELSTKDL